MGRLRRDDSGDEHPLLSRTLVGRSVSCAVRVTQAAASGEHALLTYTGTGWDVRDLGSKNGTFVDGARIEPGQPVTLVERSTLGFGTPGGWTLMTAEPPPLLAVDLVSAEVIIAAGGVLALPSDEEPLISIYQTGRGDFLVETAREPPRRLSMAEVISIGGRVFRVEPPGVAEGTPFVGGGPSVDNVTLKFQVSRNEEYVDLVVAHRGKEILLPRREHTYVLLTLARIRVGEAAQPAEERGWIDREALLKMLAMEPNALDVAIHRARRQLAQAGVERAAEVVETRPGQRRICTDRIEIA